MGVGGRGRVLIDLVPRWTNFPLGDGGRNKNSSCYRNQKHTLQALLFKTLILFYGFSCVNFELLKLSQLLIIICLQVLF